MEFQKKSEECNEKLIKARQNSSSKEAGCCCLDILKFAFCGLVCCKKTRGVVKDVKEHQQKQKNNSKEDVNENKFEKAAEEIEVSEKTTLLSDFEKPPSPLQVVENCEEKSEKETKLISQQDKEEEHRKISLKSSEEEEVCEEENLVSKEDISQPDTSRKTPEGSEEKNKGLDAETQAPTPKRFLVRTDSIQSHQKEVDTEMVAAVAGTNQFYTLVSEVNF